MKVTGTATLHATRERVFAALNDPAVLARTIPGCQQLEEVGPDRYRMTVTAGVASIKGTYVGDVALTGQEAPGSFVLKASGSGAPGTVSADVRVALEEAGDGATLLRYDADAVVGGPVGGVGQRVLTGVAKKTAGEFFGAVDDVLTGRAPAPVPGSSTDPAGADGSPAPGTGGGTGPRTFGPPPPPAGADGGAFLRGAVVGAALALTGVVVGGLLTRGQISRGGG